VIGIVLYDLFVGDVLHARLLKNPPPVTSPARPEHPVPPARPVPDEETALRA
jgi:glycerol uptake facilitator protein